MRITNFVIQERVLNRDQKQSLPAKKQIEQRIQRRQTYKKLDRVYTKKPQVKAKI